MVVLRYAQSMNFTLSHTHTPWQRTIFGFHMQNSHTHILLCMHITNIPTEDNHIADMHLLYQVIWEQQHASNLKQESEKIRTE